jgi:hypothetical protein
MKKLLITERDEIRLEKDNTKSKRKLNQLDRREIQLSKVIRLYCK